MDDAKKEELNKIYHAHSLELFALANRYSNRIVNEGIEDGDELLLLKRAQLQEMLELLRNQKRTLDYHAGEPIEPKVQHTSIVLKGEADMGGAL